MVQEREEKAIRPIVESLFIIHRTNIVFLNNDMNHMLSTETSLRSLPRSSCVEVANFNLHGE